MSPVHPRSRGERPNCNSGPPFGCGSSPLARGTHCVRVPVHLDHRFIPARAGNACTGRRCGCPCAVHPRSRGERGSGIAARSGDQRFIPARAGNARGSVCNPRRLAVHPRSRGERNAEPYDAPNPAGSSPLARGTPLLEIHGDFKSRFIPARAGNAWPAACGCRARTVHPRSRGERGGEGEKVLLLAGSSPLARGTLQQRQRHRSNERFIPARAGNARRDAAAPAGSPVHPRSRGERRATSAALSPCCGSSPLARGTPDRPTARDMESRFIPARAGNA